MMRVVLAITDEAAIEASLRASLAGSDLLLTVRSVEEAVRKLISVQADIALLDESAARNRAALEQLQGYAPTLPIIVLTGRSDNETRASYLLWGARDCLTKPFSFEALRQVIDKACNGHALQPAGMIASHEPLPHANPIKQHQTALRWLSRMASHLRDPERFSHSLLECVADVFDALRCAILLETDTSVRIAASMGLPDDVVYGVQLEFMSGVMRWFEERMSLIDRDAPQTPPQAAKELQILGARLGVPLMCRGRVCGAVLLGDKVSGASYTLEERELLTTIARCASVSLENARYYHAVTREQSRLDAILTNITAGVIVVDEARRVSMMNPHAEQLLHTRFTDVSGRSVQKLGSGFADVVLRTLSDGKPRMRQEVRNAGTNEKLSLSATPIASEGVAVVFNKAPEENAPREDVVYSPFWEYLATRVAQEIKNPMVAINTFAQLLPRKYDETDFREAFAEVVQKEIARINSVVDTLNEFAQHPRLVMRKLDFNETVRNVLKTFESEINARQIELEAEWDPDALVTDLDPTYFSQALHNVLKNSIESMPTGGKLRIKTRRNQDLAEVTIADSGKGISDADAPNLYMPFFSTKEKGMGLGLTVANRILRQHDGELTFASGDDGGSAFALRVPLAGADHADHPGD